MLGISSPQRRVPINRELLAALDRLARAADLPPATEVLRAAEAARKLPWWV